MGKIIMQATNIFCLIRVNSPADLRELSVNQLPQLCDEIRKVPYRDILCESRAFRV